MLRLKYSKILLSDYDGMSDRAPGMPILLSHGKLVSRGDLITLDNISVPNVFTITINKDNFSQLCTVGNPGLLFQYTLRSGTRIANGVITTDATGMYVSTVASGTGWHGPMMYTLLPSVIGKSGQYWHLKYAYNYYDPSSSMVNIVIYSGSILYCFTDGDNSTPSDNTYEIRMINGLSVQTLYSYRFYGKNTISATIKIYHSVDNRTKVYYNNSVVYDNLDPILSLSGSNLLCLHFMQYDTYAILQHHISEITVSTDPSYDPLP